ncbi:hypothetical protein [Bradyrhizobium sp. SZCCHNRI1005]|uniref:hypothetical protein n=1 Tax=Bradyrhizobium sp. SZCCHNRI1005 TaxID=3057276 RepID=UPI0028E74095|nr:hypothetical protein [Bradyrhizobium sp. SZCCHNRI1005]
MPQDDGLASQLRHVALDQHGEAIRAFVANSPIPQRRNFADPRHLLPRARQGRCLAAFLTQHVLEGMDCPQKSCSTVPGASFGKKWIKRRAASSISFCFSLLGIRDPGPQFHLVLAGGDQGEHLGMVRHMKSLNEQNARMLAAA